MNAEPSHSPERSRLDFVHRKTQEGYSSICMSCYLTVASSVDEDGLVDGELNHSRECWATTKKPPQRVS